jgi:glycosyltransferase involved in cell wall biosynthesis
VKVGYVYANPRRELAAQVAVGRAPDTTLLGQNHLAAVGIEAIIHEPAVRRQDRLAGLRHRLTWNVRELTLPWELGAVDVAVTPLVNLFPLTARIRGRPRILLLNYGVTTIWQRASPARRRLLRRALASCAMVACLARGQRERLLEQTALDPERIRVIEIGVDERFFTATPPPRDGHVLAVGKDLARDYATLARAMEGLERPVRLVAEPRNLGGVSLPPNVEVLRRVSWPTLRDLYERAACVVVPLRRPDHPYGTEGSGLTALVEAMAAARPVVVSDRSVHADYVDAEASALIVPPEDPAALRTSVDRVLGDPELGGRLGARARQVVEERLTTRHLAERLAAALRSLDG